MRRARGRFITFEGGEGAGKTTQIRLLAEALRAHPRIGGEGIGVLATREPGGSPGAEDIRKLLVEGEVGRWDALTECLLHFAARHDHLQQTVLPAIERGDWVLSDRFADSTMAYQGYGHGLDRETVRRLYRLVVGEFAPHLTFILDVPVGTGLRRAEQRQGAIVSSDAHPAEDRYERMDVEFHRRLRDGFLDIARREPKRCVVIDGGGEREATHATILALVKERFGLGDG